MARGLYLFFCTLFWALVGCAPAKEPQEKDPALADSLSLDSSTIDNEAEINEGYFDDEENTQNPESLVDEVSDSITSMESIYGTYELQSDHNQGEFTLSEIDQEEMVGFELLVIGPPPGTHIASIEEGMITYSNNSRQGTYLNQDCKLSFEWIGNGRVKLTQTGSDFECGFGANMEVSGIYLRKNGSTDNPAKVFSTDKTVVFIQKPLDTEGINEEDLAEIAADLGYYQLQAEEALEQRDMEFDTTSITVIEFRTPSGEKFIFDAGERNASPLMVIHYGNGQFWTGSTIDFIESPDDALAGQ